MNLSAVMSLALALGIVIATQAPAAELAMESTSTKKPVIRLSPDVVPVRYSLTLTPDLNKATFDGTEQIQTAVARDVLQVILHAKELNVSEASIRSRRASASRIQLKTAFDKENELLVLTPEQPISPGDYMITLHFSGILNDKLAGFYRSTFTDRNGKKHNLAATQMEATDARRMFPCFDEPGLKAKFKLKAIIDPSDVAISNAAVISDTIDTTMHKRIIQFAETDKIATYMVALLVGRFKPTAPVVVEGIEIKTWAVEGKEHLGVFARQTAAKLLPYFNSYYKVPYPWKKLDLIAVPDFEAGAMENPGAITFRETLLLVDSKTASIDALRDVAGVLAHEMAHMWFGDLVTMKWWDDLWLNEAFATWMSTKAVDAVMPKWKFYMGYVMSRIHSMETDALRSTRPIHKEVLNPDQANEMFDVITYSKGASILRMLEHYVKEPVFQEGVHQYLKDHAFGNATTDDLWKAIGLAAKQQISELMHGWVYQPGYPVLSATAPGNELRFKQNRFLLEKTVEADDTIWEVPIGLRQLTGNWTDAKDVPTQAALLPAREGSVPVPYSFPLNINSGAVGYFRVNYSSAQLKSIFPVIQTSMNAAERMSLLSDEFALVVAGQASLQDWFALLGSYRTERDYAVWETLLGQIDALDYFVADSARRPYQKFVGDQVSKIWQQLRWKGKPGESDLDKILRGRIVSILGTVGQDKQIIAESRRQFNNYLKNEFSVDADLVGPITTVVAYNGAAADFDKLYSLYKRARTPEIENRNLMSLGEFRTKGLIDRALKLTLSAEVRNQDAPKLLSLLMQLPSSRRAAWQFVKQNWDKIVASYPEQMVPHVVGRASLTDWAGYEDLKAFFTLHKVKSGEATVARMLERTRIDAGFADSASQPLSQWLLAHYRQQ